MIRFGGTCLVLAAVQAGGWPAAAVADPSVDPYALSPEQLFAAEVISPARTPESVWEAPAAISVLTAADIERAGVTSIPEALRLAPGVDVAQINSSGWAISARGFNSALANKLLVLIDGREIYDPLFSGVYWDVQDTPLQDIERIEVVRGPGASLWGANAVNGVINIITKSAADTQGALVSATAGDQERGALTARYGGAFGDSGHWRIYGAGFERTAQELLTGGDDHSAWQALRGGFRTDVSLSARDDLTIQGDIYHSETGQWRLVPTLSAPFETLARDDITAEGGNLLARWTRQFDGGGVLSAQTYFDLTRRSQALLEDRRRTYDLDVQYQFPTYGAHALVAGMRYRDTRDDINQTESITAASDSHGEQLISAFVQDQIALAPAWRLTLGSKFDDTDYTGLEIQPSVRLQWMGEQQMAWGAVSRAVRSPSELEREYNFILAAGPPIPPLTVPTTIELAPSPDFDSEELVAYELGYRRQWTPDLAMDITLFHNEYDGLSTLSTRPAQFALDPPRFIIVPIEITNATSAATNGVEVMFDWRVRQNFGVTASYSFLDMELRGPPAPLAIDSEAAEGQSPRNQASLRLRWDATDRLAIDGTFYYVDNLPSYDIDAYTRFDLRIGWRLTNSVELELVGQNLLDNRHREFVAPGDANAAEIQRSIFGRLTWRG
jgi:iron complex outermembrane receptor protein